MIDILKNKTVKYGEYKINYKIKRICLNELLELIRKNTEITNKGNGEVVFTTTNVNKLLSYLINNITNINKKTNYKYSIEELLELEDTNLKRCLDELTNILTTIINEYKNIIINKVDNVGRTLKEINKIEELM